MYKDLLPVGSVVQLKGGVKRLMVCGRVVAGGEQGEIHDYVGCYYPEGIVDSSQLFFFEQDAIEDVFFIGFQDKEEINFKRSVLAQLDEGTLAVEDGQIVLKQK
ncbi:MAG: DUF4176 domain-containing protein [Lachnospiraceae bacterium]|nr:DUF4176 domain-containing protein [Lachnospiraceae bacterium]